MYAMAPDIQIESRPDLWRKGRYRMELTVELGSPFDEVDATLARLGYEAVDDDQRGRSYHHRTHPHRTAELDEVQYGRIGLRLILHRGDLGTEDVDDAAGELTAVYGKIRSACGSCGQGDGYRLRDPASPEVVYEQADFESWLQRRNRH